MIDVTGLVWTVFSGLSVLVIEDVQEAGEVICVRVARKLAGRAGARLLPARSILVSRHPALRVLLRIPLPVLGVPKAYHHEPSKPRMRAHPVPAVTDG